MANLFNDLRVDMKWVMAKLNILQELLDNKK